MILKRTESNTVFDYFFFYFLGTNNTIMSKNLFSNFRMLSIRLGLFSEDCMSIFHI